ncbi:MAG TPA: MFS transporter [Gaiellaceae bacterium]|nr:MFS transporter [Gaiellaceae bacterium]
MTLIVAVALAAADSAIVVLAVPQLLVDFGQSITSTAWVVTAYNLAAAIAGVVVVVAAARLRTRSLLAAGLVVFAAATIGCSLAPSLSVLVALRAVQGVGGALVLASAFVELGPAVWAAAAAIGAAAGPALGGTLTQVFDWRAIFVAQAPVAVVAVLAALRSEDVGLRSRGLGRPDATASVGLISGALVGALFLAVVLLVEGHGFSPLAAAGMVSILPVSALAVRWRFPSASVPAGVIVLAGGLALFSVAPGSIPVNVAALAACGAGLGICLPPTSEDAGVMGVASRHAGIVLGLLLLAPMLSDDLSHNADSAKTKGIVMVLKAPVPLLDKIPLTINLYRALRSSGHGKLPDFTSAFDKARRADADAVPKLDALQQSLDQIQKDAIASSFRRPFAVAAILALLALVPLGAGRVAAVARLPA